MSKELPPNEYSVSVDESSLDSTDDGPVIIIGASILAVLAMIFVALRFWSKRLSGNSWKLDEWLVLAALITHFSLMASSFVGVRKGGLGRDIDALVYNDPKALVVLFKVSNYNLIIFILRLGVDLMGESRLSLHPTLLTALAHLW